MDPIKTLGHLLEGDVMRDAVHVSIVVATTHEILQPGQHVGLLDVETCRVGEAKQNIGVVDPFLKNEVLPDQKFWLFLFPGTVTSLYHEWTHPAFDAGKHIPRIRATTAESVVWLTEFAYECGMSYEELLAAARNYADYGDYHTMRSDTPDRVYSESDSLWNHLHIVEPETFTSAFDQGTFITCSC